MDPNSISQELFEKCYMYKPGHYEVSQIKEKLKKTIEKYFNSAKKGITQKRIQKIREKFNKIPETTLDIQAKSGLCPALPDIQSLSDTEIEILYKVDKDSEFALEIVSILNIRDELEIYAGTGPYPLSDILLKVSDMAWYSGKKSKSVG